MNNKNTSISETGEVRGTKYCIHCGAQIAENARYCKFCGNAQGSRREPGGKAVSYGGVDYGVNDDSYIPPEPAEPASRFGGKQIITAVVLGVCVLAAIVFAVSIFMNRDTDGNDASTQETTTQQAATENSVVRPTKPTDDQSETDAPVAGSYSSYSHAELYDFDTPMFFPDSDERRLSEDELVGLSWDQLQKAANDIYARNGLIFKSEGCKDYYPAQDWANGYTDDMNDVRSNMNDYEIDNIETIKKMQERLKPSSDD